ncbi:hypothetical protein [Chthonobacter rhizosphaerae]|uniref:hypothetical protein n=1 Tax=Chthonobacter rhizosphaerae TaxID=2735553 RepID=UPI0015EEA814|nr:hypothetical protein [Chthonobacter rhizosphaerae]
MSQGRLIQDKVVSYLNGLSPGARALLLRTLETKAGGEADAEARLILDATRTAIHGNGAVLPDPATVKDSFFQPFAPFVIPETLTPRQPGWIAAQSIDAIWTYLTRVAMTEQFRPWLHPHALRGYSTERHMNDNLGVLRSAAVGELARQAAAAAEHPKKLQRFIVALGGEEVLRDAMDLIDLAGRLPTLERLLMRLPVAIQPWDPTERLAIEQTVAFVHTYPKDLELAALAVASRAPSTSTLARVALALADEDDDIATVRRSDGRVFVDVALSVVQRSVTRYAGLREDPNGLDAMLQEIRRYHEAVRAVTGVLALEEDGTWLKRLSELRRAMSGLILEDIGGVVALIRAALTVSAGHPPAEAEARDAIRAVALLMAVRKSKDALALNELVTRLVPVVERSLEVQGGRLIEQLRKSRGEFHAAIRAASDTLISLSALTFGDEHAALVQKSRDIAAASRPTLPSFE